MATLIEEINIRIRIYGGRNKLASDIEKEWLNPFKQRHGQGGNNKNPIWTKEEKKILSEGITEIANKINRSRAATYAKLLTENMI